MPQTVVAVDDPAGALRRRGGEHGRTLGL